MARGGIAAQVEQDTPIILGLGPLRFRKRLVGAGQVSRAPAHQIEHRQRAVRAGPPALARLQQSAERAVEIRLPLPAPRLVRRPRHVAQRHLERARPALRLAQHRQWIPRRAHRDQHHRRRARRGERPRYQPGRPLPNPQRTRARPQPSSRQHAARVGRKRVERAPLLLRLGRLEQRQRFLILGVHSPLQTHAPQKSRRVSVDFF